MHQTATRTASVFGIIDRALLFVEQIVEQSMKEVEMIGTP